MRRIRARLSGPVPENISTLLGTRTCGGRIGRHRIGWNSCGVQAMHLFNMELKILGAQWIGRTSITSVQGRDCHWWRAQSHLSWVRSMRLEGRFRITCKMVCILIIQCWECNGPWTFVDWHDRKMIRLQNTVVGQNPAPPQHFTLEGRIATPVPPHSMLARPLWGGGAGFWTFNLFLFLIVEAPMLMREKRAARKVCAKWCRILSINSMAGHNGDLKCHCALV